MSNKEVQKLIHSAKEILNEVDLDGLVFVGFDTDQQPYLLFGGALDAMVCSGTLEYIKLRMFNMFEEKNAIEEMQDLYALTFDDDENTTYEIAFEPDFDLDEDDTEENDPRKIIPFSKKPLKH